MPRRFLAREGNQGIHDFGEAGDIFPYKIYRAQKRTEFPDRGRPRQACDCFYMVVPDFNAFLGNDVTQIFDF